MERINIENLRKEAKILFEQVKILKNLAEMKENLAEKEEKKLEQKIKEKKLDQKDTVKKLDQKSTVKKLDQKSTVKRYETFPLIAQGDYSSSLYLLFSRTPEEAQKIANQYCDDFVVEIVDKKCDDEDIEIFNTEGYRYPKIDFSGLEAFQIKFVCVVLQNILKYIKVQINDIPIVIRRAYREGSILHILIVVDAQISMDVEFKIIDTTKMTQIINDFDDGNLGYHIPRIYEDKDRTPYEKFVTFLECLVPVIFAKFKRERKEFYRKKNGEEYQKHRTIPLRQIEKDIHD